jgi:hypothetical protein
VTETRIAFPEMERYQNHLFAATASGGAASKDLGARNLVQEMVMEASRLAAGEIATVSATGDGDLAPNKRRKKSRSG